MQRALLSSRLIAASQLRLPSSAEMQRCDEHAIASGQPAALLMERAGSAVAFEVVRRYRAELARNPRVTVLCGPGNNGGDGLVVGRLLKLQGYRVQCFISGAPRYSIDFSAQLARFNGHALRVSDTAAPLVKELPSASLTDLERALHRSSVVIDALLGTGQTAAPRGTIALLVDALLASGTSARIVSVDVPTGINPDTGECFQPHVRAGLTCAIELVKRGLVQFPAGESCGEIVLHPIGILKTGEHPVRFSVLSTDGSFPERPFDAHKGSLGRVLVVGGSRAMPGASILTAHGALYAGAGLVFRAENTAWSAGGLAPEIIRLPLNGEPSEPGGLELWRALRSRPELKEAVWAVGPGLGTSEGACELVRSLLEGDGERPIVLDADGLNVIAPRLQNASVSWPHVVLTPHPGEAARLLGVTVAEIQRDRYSAAERLVERSGATVVLKGARTIILSATSAGFVNLEDTPFLATPGSGDVLAGLIAALLARGLSTIDAARFGVLVHGRAGIAAAQGGPIAASDIVRHLPSEIRRLGNDHCNSSGERKGRAQ